MSNRSLQTLKRRNSRGGLRFRRLSAERFEDRNLLAAGDFDLTFGGTGYVTTDFGFPGTDQNYEQAYVVLSQPDGKIIQVAMMGGDAAVYAAGVVRYNGDGSLDTGFHGDGKAFIPNIWPRAAALQADGKILIGGETTTSLDKDFKVARLNSDGSPDLTFSGDGVVTIDFGTTNEMLTALAVQSDNKVVMAGVATAATWDFAVGRLNADGTLDTSFSGDGKITTDFVSDSDQPTSVVIQTDGKILVGGSADNGTYSDYALARYTSAGVLDTTFSGDGKLLTDFGASSSDQLNGLALQSDGKIVAAGGSHNGARWNFSLARYSAAGVLDSTFSSDGLVTFSVGSLGDIGDAVALQSDGKIVMVGTSAATNTEGAVVRFTTTGSADTTFSGDGKLTFAVGPDSDQPNSVAIQTDGKIVLGGIFTGNGGHSDSFLARYLTNGNPDTSFSGDGLLTPTIASGEDLARDVVVQPDGRIVVAGFAFNGADNDLALLRYLPDGSPDPTFDGDGRVTADFGAGGNSSGAVALQADGKIVVVGPSTLARFSASGSLDPAFDGDGLVTLDFTARDVAVQADGKIVVVGGKSNGTNNDFVVARYNTNGAVDTGFDGDGRVVTTFSSGDEQAYALAIGGDGKIVVAGYAVISSVVYFAVARYNTNGVPDTGFDSDGKATMSMGSSPLSVAIQPDNKIVVGGDGAGATNDLAVVRFNANGSPDTTFSGDGKHLVDFGSYETGGYVAVDADGKIILVGFSTVNTDYDLAVARLTSAGALDTTFSGDGMSVAAIPTTREQPYGMALQPDGRIVAAGSANSFTNFGYDVIVARLEMDSTLTAAISAGSLTISDASASGRKNSLTLGRSGANLVLTDAVERFQSAPAGGTLSDGNRTLTIPLSSITAGVTLNTASGDDTLTVDFSAGNPIPLGNLIFNGGAGGNDLLALQGGTYDSVNYSFTNANDGGISLDPDGPGGTAASLITYTGLDPLTSSIAAANVTLTYTGAAETIAVTNPGSGQTTVASTLGETTTFANPTNALTINATNGTDIVNVNSLASNYASLSITGDDTTDVVNVNSAIALASGFNLSINTGTINLATTTADLSTLGPGTSSLTALQQIAFTAGSSITTVNGNVTLQANLSGTAAGNFAGIYLPGAAISTTGTGNLSLTGKGAVSSADFNYGIYVGNSQLTSTATGLAVGQGMISLTGSGGGGAAITHNSGVVIDDGSLVQTASGKITISGTAGLGTTDNNGVVIGGFHNGGTVTSANGDIEITGQGGATATGINNSGITVVQDTSGSYSGGVVSSTGSGTITLQGTGGGTGAASNFNDGIVVNGSSAKITSVNGAISLTGQGGTSAGGVHNEGVILISGGVVQSSGAATISVTGTGGGNGGPNADSGNHGVDVSGTGAKITSATGAITIVGQGGVGAQGDINDGVLLYNGGAIESTGTASISIQGTGGGTGANSHFNEGVVVYGAGSTVSSTSGPITITGIEGVAPTAAVLIAAGGSIANSSAAALTSLIGNSMALTGGTINVGTKTVELRQRTTGTAVNLGATIDTGGGPLGLSDAELDTITAGTTQIGDANSGAIIVQAALTHSNNLSLTTGAGITFQQSVTQAVNKSLTANAVGTISLLIGTGDLTTTGSGSISLTTARDISMATGSSVTTVNGNITLYANLQTTASTGNFTGIDVNGLIQSTGTGGVTVKGRGGNGAGNQYGVALAFNGDGDIIGGTSAPVVVEGTGGAGTSSNNFGVEIRGTNTPSITSAGANVSVTGFGGGSGSTQGNLGVEVGPSATISAGGSGTVLVQGTGGATTGVSNHGVQVNGVGAVITSSGGAVQVTGQGGGSGGSGSNAGVNLLSSGTITAGGSATVNVQGTGGASAGGSNVGVWLFTNTTSITSGGGNVTVVGQGAGTGSFGAAGVTVNGTISAGSTGNVSVQGTASLTNTAGSNLGVSVVGTVTSNGGNVQVTGTGAGSGVTGSNTGVSVSGLITAGGLGTVTVNGTGGGGASFNYGVDLTGVSGTINSGGGNVSVVGQGGGTGTGSSNLGVHMIGGTFLRATGAGTVTVQGTGGTGATPGSSHHGVDLAGGTITSAGGNLQITGQGGPVGLSQNMGVRISSNGTITVPSTGSITIDGAGGGGTQNDAFNLGPSSSGGSVAVTGSGNITIIGDRMVIDPSGTINGGANSVTLRPKINGTTINLGAADAAGVLGLTDAELDRVTAGTLQIGNAGSGAITVSAVISPASYPLLVLAKDTSFTSAGGLTLDITSPSNFEKVQVNGAISINAAAALTVNSTYNAVALDNFTLLENTSGGTTTGTFTGKPEGTTIPVGTFNKKLTYVGGTGNDVVVGGITTQYVVTSAATATGARFTLSKPAAIAPLNLYDYRDSGGNFVLGAADVQLVNGVGQSIVGSLMFDATDTSFTFVATNGTLPADNYTLSIRSATDGFRTAASELLDGDADGFAGGNFSQVFTVTAPPANAVTISLPNFARGPEQAVNVPADVALGLPVRISNANQVGSLTFELRFDAGLLNVTGVTLPASAPPGSTANLTTLGTGYVRVTLTFGSPLAAGAQTVAYLQAAVPTSAASRYGEREVLDLSALDLRDGGGVTIPALDQDAVHSNAYFGEVGRNGRYDSFDVQQVSRQAVRLDTGFQQYPLLDPVILADFNGNNRVDSFDVQRVSRLALRLAITEAPALPSPTPTTTDTDRIVAEEPPPEKTSVEPPPVLRSDIDGNGAVDAQDVLWAIYYFNRQSSGTAAAEAPLKKLDINGDEQFDAADILFAITDVNSESQEPEGEAQPASQTEEPAADLDGLVGLLAEDLTADRKRK